MSLFGRVAGAQTLGAPPPNNATRTGVLLTMHTLRPAPKRLADVVFDLLKPLTTPAAAPNVATGTLPFNTAQPLLPHPPLVTPPAYEQKASDLVFAASMSKQLGDNMTAAGIPRPADTAAHHIVAWNDIRAVTSRNILTGFGIDINDAANGVFLPNSVTAANALTPSMYHRTLHTDAYHEEVFNRLSVATTKERALEILDDIRTDLRNGTFPIVR